MNVSTRLDLGRFKARPYQLKVMRALEEHKKRKLVCIMPRRAGKDIMAWNMMIREAAQRIAVYFYIFPTYAQGKKVLWDSLTNDGVRFLDYIPSQIIESTNSQEMKIRLKNGSLIQIVGSDNVDSLVGTNAYGVVFSEYALQDPKAYQFLRPILTANGGWCLFISTPRGKNHLYEMFQIAQANPQEWFSTKLTVEDTGHIPLWEIEKEKADGIMSEDLIQQEYYCSWDMGVEGAYYSKYLDKMRVDGRIGQVPWESAFKVHTSWDIGNDSTSIIFFQTIGQTVRLIDAYENSNNGLEHYIKVLNQKPYSYGKHIGPHDLRVKEWASGMGMTRVEKARQLGINFIIAPDLSIEDGIESVRSAFSKIWIDNNNCAGLLKSLENYRKEYDSKRRVYKDIPLHNWASHYSDSMRYLAISLPKTRDGLSAEELDGRYREATMGHQSKMPAFFRDDAPKW